MLDRNYRSTENILNAANAVIANNSHRMEKKLWSDKGDGEKASPHIRAQDEKDEGRFIAREIIERKKSGGRFSDIALFCTEQMPSQER